MCSLSNVELNSCKFCTLESVESVIKVIIIIIKTCLEPVPLTVVILV